MALPVVIRKSFAALIEKEIKSQNVVFDENFEMLQQFVSKSLDKFEILYDAEDVTILSNIIMDNLQYQKLEEEDTYFEYCTESGIECLQECVENAFDEIGSLSVDIDNYSFADIMELSEKIDTGEISSDSPIADKFFMLQYFRSKLQDYIDSFQLEISKLNDEYEKDKLARESI